MPACTSVILARALFLPPVRFVLRYFGPESAVLTYLVSLRFSEGSGKGKGRGSKGKSKKKKYSPKGDETGCDPAPHSVRAAASQANVGE